MENFEVLAVANFSIICYRIIAISLKEPYLLIGVFMIAQTLLSCQSVLHMLFNQKNDPIRQFQDIAMI